MPIYEYICPQCNGRFSRLVRGFSDPSDLQCPRCQNTEVRRAISRVSVVRSEESRLESMGDPSMFSDLDESNPASVARWAKKMGQQMGEEMGDDWDEMVDQMMDEELNDKGEGGAGAGRAEDLGWG
jgi:putative FmdB family regulatory protein